MTGGFYQTPFWRRLRGAPEQQEGEHMATALKDAMHKAGLRSMSEVLRDMAREAASDTGYNHIRAAQLLWARLSEKPGPEIVTLIGRERGERLCADFLHEIIGRARLPQNDGGDGANVEMPKGQASPAPPAVAGSTRHPAAGAAREGGSGQKPRAGNGQGESAAPVTFTPARAPVGAIAILGALRREKIAGKPLGDCTAAEARAEAKRNNWRARWLAILTENLAGDAVIGEWRDDEDVERAMKAAREQAHD